MRARLGVDDLDRVIGERRDEQFVAAGIHGHVVHSSFDAAQLNGAKELEGFTDARLDCDHQQKGG
jgi:hypothetical protein